jgi:ribosomal protein L14
MLLKESWLFIADNTNVRWIKLFHLYKGFHRKSTKIGFFAKGSSRVVEPPRIEYKGFKYKFNLKGDIVRSLIVRSNLPNSYIDGSKIFMVGNSGFLIKKKQEPKSKFLNGPISRCIRRRKFLSLFKLVL